MGALNVINGTDGGGVVAVRLATARNIGGVSFDGTADINLPGVNAAGNQDTTGNAATAAQLETARTIGGVSFDGSGNINLPGVNQAGTQNTSGTANNATNLNSIAATNYARKDSAAGRQDFANSIHVSGTHDVSGSTVGVSTTSNIGAFTGSP